MCCSGELRSVVLVGRRLDDHGISSTFRGRWTISCYADHCDVSQVKEVMNQVEGKWIAWKMDSMEVMSFYSKIIPADETQEQVTADGSPTVALRTELFHREAFIRKKITMALQ